MTVALPAVLLFGALTYLLVRVRAIRALEALIVGAFGFFLATTGLGNAITAFLSALLNLHGATHGTPTPPPTGGIPL